MNYLVAVSGGVDSVVLLDMLAKTDHRLVVAHVDHGIRGKESAADARFVRELARQYRLPFVTTELKLGARASEERAREGRYAFLFDQAKRHRAVVVTAHHCGDMIESVAVNLSRGTGWRGLAVLDRDNVWRPLLAFTKQQLYDYATARRLEWVEDETNRTETYLRNRLRRRIDPAGAAAVGAELARLRARQLQLRRDIDHEVARVISGAAGSRYFMGQIDEKVAMELLGAQLALVKARPIRPRLVRALHAIKVGKPGTRYDVGDGMIITLTARKYQVTVV